MFCIPALKRIFALLSHDAGEMSRRVEKCGGGRAAPANVIASALPPWHPATFTNTITNTISLTVIIAN
jgi:hypothetical protein